MKEITVKFYISQYVDGDLEIECKHIHYAFDERFNFEKFPRQDLINYMAEIQEHCITENIKPIFEVI
jgi:hypothetical protein